MSALSVPPRRVVLSYGIFDGLPPREARLLQSLSQLGSEVIIGCATDTHCAAMGTKPQLAYEHRRALLESSRFVDRVIAQTSEDQKRTDIVNYNVSVIAMPDSWRGRFDDLQDLAQVIYLPDLARVISTDIPADLSQVEAA